MHAENVAFIVLLISATIIFSLKVREIIRNINLGTDVDRSDHPSERWKTMLMVAIGQSKMVKRPFAGVLHIFVYVGFVIINLEVLEIIIDGATGTHRIFSFLGGFYDFLIASFEILALLVLTACVIFLLRRISGVVKRFQYREMTS